MTHCAGRAEGFGNMTVSSAQRLLPVAARRVMTQANVSVMYGVGFLCTAWAGREPNMFIFTLILLAFCLDLSVIVLLRHGQAESLIAVDIFCPT